MFELLSSIKDAIKMQLFQNGTFVAITASGLILGLTVYLKSIPYYIYRFMLRWFTVEIYIDSRSEYYEVLNEFFMLKFNNANLLMFKSFNKGTNQYPDDALVTASGIYKKILTEDIICNKLQNISMRIDKDKDDDEIDNDGDVINKNLYKYKNVINPGIGSFYCFINRTLIILNKSIEKNNFNILEKINIRVFTRKNKKAKKIVFDSILKIVNNQKEYIDIAIRYDEYWDHNFIKKEKRDIKTIFLNDNIVYDLIDDIRTFFMNKKIYKDKGIPFKRGYLLYGPPGTGKSSLIFAISSMLDMKIYYIGNNSFTSEQMLLESFSTVPNDGILVLEDIDTFKITNKREENTSENKNEEKKYNLLQCSNTITLSSILNVMDGILSSGCPIMFFTTNKLEKLDPALIRPGRIDRIYFLDLLNKDTTIKMIKSFFNDIDISEDYLNNSISDDIKISGAQLQSILIANLNNLEKVIENISKIDYSKIEQPKLEFDKKN